MRAIPFCATACTGSPVIFSPSKITSPAVGLSTLVIKLNRVDFPAPLGPITARIVPAIEAHVDTVERDQRAEAPHQALALKQRHRTSRFPYPRSGRSAQP